MSLKDPLMLDFVVTIGLNANLARLHACATALMMFLFVVLGLLNGTVIELLNCVCVLFVGVILSNMLAFTGFYTVFERAVSGQPVAVSGDGANEPAAVGAGLAGAADAGAVGDFCHLSGDGQ